MLTAIKNVILGFIMLLIPLLVFTTLNLLMYPDDTFGESLQYTLSNKNPLCFPLSIFYFLYTMLVTYYTIDKIND